MTKRGYTIAAGLCAAGMLLNGCSRKNQKAWMPQESDAISVASDGSVTEIVQESLDQAYYDQSELDSMIRSSVEAYNQENGGNAVKVVSFKTRNDTVTLELRYASGRDFADFNNVEFYQGSMLNAQLEGFLFDVPFYRIEDGEISGSTVDSGTVLKDLSAEVVIVQAPLEVHVDGDVTYTSTNAEMLSENTVSAKKNEEGAGSTSLLLPSGSVHSETERSYEDQKKANLVYIIYE